MMEHLYKYELLCIVQSAHLRRFMDVLDDEERPFELTVKRSRETPGLHHLMIDCDDAMYFHTLLKSCENETEE